MFKLHLSEVENEVLRKMCRIVISAHIRTTLTDVHAHTAPKDRSKVPGVETTLAEIWNLIDSYERIVFELLVAYRRGEPSVTLGAVEFEVLQHLLSKTWVSDGSPDTLAFVQTLGICLDSLKAAFRMAAKEAQRPPPMTKTLLVNPLPTNIFGSPRTKFKE